MLAKHDASTSWVLPGFIYCPVLSEHSPAKRRGGGVGGSGWRRGGTLCRPGTALAYQSQKAWSKLLRAGPHCLTEEPIEVQSGDIGGAVRCLKVEQPVTDQYVLELGLRNAAVAQLLPCVVDDLTCLACSGNARWQDHHTLPANVSPNVPYASCRAEADLARESDHTARKYSSNSKTSGTH